MFSAACSAQRVQSARHAARRWSCAATAAAMVVLVGFGSTLAVHVPAAWKLERNLASGIGMFATVLLLAITGWLLYYASGEATRAWSSCVHMAVGIAAPLVLFWHLAYRKQRARGTRRKEQEHRPAFAAGASENVLSLRPTHKGRPTLTP